MDEPLQPKSKSIPQRRVGFYRNSVMGFLVAIVLMFVIAPFVELFQSGLGIESVIMTLVLVSGVFAVGKSRWALAVAVVLVAPALVARWAYHLWPNQVPEGGFIVPGLLFVLFVIIRLLVFILRAPRVNSEVLCAGLSTYLLIGLLWSFAYRLVAILDPHAFVITITSVPDTPIRGFKALYFSLITLSTVGYGDIVPVSNVARMLAAMEAMTGTLFVAVLIARLVALYTSQSHIADASNPDERQKS